jgi:hypothetical protein
LSEHTVNIQLTVRMTLSDGPALTDQQVFELVADQLGEPLRRFGLRSEDSLYFGDVVQAVPVPPTAAILPETPLGAPVPRVARVAGLCPCSCNSGGFCGGCGHAGCGRR